MRLSFSTSVTMSPPEQIAAERGLGDHGRAQVALDSEVVRLCSPYVPVDTGTLQRSGSTATDFGSGEVMYSTPYARRIYYTHKGAAAHSAKTQDPRAGSLWLERMKADHMNDLKSVVERETGGKCE